MVAADWLAKRMYDLGYIQKLDKEALAPAFENLSPEVKAPSSDPDWTFSIPWQGGMTGLIVNKDKAPDVRSINDLFDPRYRGKVEVLGELQETVPLLMKADGVDPESATEADWLDAIERLQKAVDSGQIRRTTGADYDERPGHGRRGRGHGLGCRRHSAAGRRPEARVEDAHGGVHGLVGPLGDPGRGPEPHCGVRVHQLRVRAGEPGSDRGLDQRGHSGGGVKEIFQETDPEAAKSELIFPTAEYTKNCSTPLSPPGGAESKRRVEEAFAAATGA